MSLKKEQLYEFDRARFERETQGKYTLVFPFSELTERLAIDLNRQSGSSSIMSNGPNPMKQLINEVKVYYDERIAFLKGNQITKI